MIFITGDTHADIRRFSKNNFPIGNELTKNDYVIILGDFGLVWSEEESEYESYWLNWLEEKPWTTLFVDGNHENFNRLYSLPVEEWNGGKVHKVRESVIHLMRGQVFNINGEKFFTFGGARSHDIDGGVLNREDANFKHKVDKNIRMGRPYRILNESWWSQEMPSIEERLEGWTNLKNNHWNVDYVLTHDCPTTALKNLDYDFRFYEPDELNDYFDEVMNEISFKKWYFGHYHRNRDVNSKFTCLYGSIDLLRDKDAFSFQYK